jgi:hypothetical protein
MAGQIFPDVVPNVNTPIATDGINWYAHQIDKATDGVPDLRTSLPVDRALTKIVNSYAAGNGAHGETTRYTYTVPNAKRAILEFFQSFMEIPTAATLLYSQLYISGTRILYHPVYPASVQIDADRFTPLHIWLGTGDIVKVTTFSSDAVVRVFVLNTVISEFAA